MHRFSRYTFWFAAVLLLAVTTGCADPDKPGRIKAKAIPTEVIACLSDPTGATHCRSGR